MRDNKELKGRSQEEFDKTFKTYELFTLKSCELVKEAESLREELEDKLKNVRVIQGKMKELESKLLKLKHPKIKCHNWLQEYSKSIEKMEPYLEDPLVEDISNTKDLSQNGVETKENEYMEKVEEVVVKENPLIRNVENLETMKIWETVEEVSIKSPQLVRVQSKNVRSERGDIIKR